MIARAALFGALAGTILSLLAIAYDVLSIVQL